MESGVIVTQKSSFPIKRTAEAEKTTDDAPSLETSKENIHKDVINSENNSEPEVDVIEAEFAEPETEIQTEKPVENENLTENINTENVLEAAKSEVVISEDAIDSEKTEEKISNESEVSFLEVESFEPETEAQTEESINNENLEEDAEKEEIVEALNPEVIINEDKINSKDVVEKINDESELSFHGTDAFLPEVKIEAPVSEQINPAETANSNINKHEDEMRRLIEEVEKR
ncbi:hypothetical protein [Chryseobacterium indoltheticum]|uniref:hypothetical protein n=1 Tax=Chryseobacterium indoltheticum TaxID=254 RepID=UPI003F492F0D